LNPAGRLVSEYLTIGVALGAVECDVIDFCAETDAIAVHVVDASSSPDAFKCPIGVR